MTKPNNDEQASLKLAEASREQEWKDSSFLRDLFLGKFRLDLIDPYPERGEERPEFRRFRDGIKRFLEEEVDPVEIDRLGEYPARVVDGLRALGAFGMKIPVEYGGLGLTPWEYGTVMKLIGSYDGNITALLSAHQSIGVPQPIALFGTEEQKRKYLPRCAKGAISGFALTEPEVGSDPAKLATTAEPSADGSYYVLNGTKLWCTNGTLAELLVVMARNPKNGLISAFVVEAGWEGVQVTHRCRFMGLRALANGELRFDNVKVPRENLIGAEGKGLKIALTTLNTGRLTLPAATVGAAKKCLEICRKWSNVRAQWGKPIGQHEAIAHKLADMAATTFAMEAVCDLVLAMAGAHSFDIRLEAAAAKEWNTVQAWRMVDEALQIRGGRGYETEISLASRGEAAVGIERMMRDSRINLIFEGSSEIMHLFMAREAVDRHLRVANVLIDPEKQAGEKLAALPKIAAFYAAWYPSRWTGWGRWPRYSRFGPLARHLRFVERSSRKLARESFHLMVAYQGGAQRKQAFLFRMVDVANELFVMAATICRAQRMRVANLPEAENAIALADLFCRTHRRKVKAIFKDLWHNEDGLKYRAGRDVLAGKHAWLEKGAMELGLDEEDLRPRTVRVPPARPAVAPAAAAGVGSPAALVERPVEPSSVSRDEARPATPAVTDADDERLA